MASTILICGKTSSGKTTAIRTLNPDETVIISVINRTLPFKHANKYVKNKNYFLIPTYDKIISCIEWANKKKEVKNIVITDATYIIRQEYFSRASESGYKRFTDFAVHMQQILLAIQKCRADIKVFMEYHVEGVKNADDVVEYKPSTVGKLLDDQYNICENVDIILFAEPQYEDKQIVYGFYTNRTLNRLNSEIPAKSPAGMFEDIFIPNDLASVSQKIDEYYGTDETTEEGS